MYGYFNLQNVYLRNNERIVFNSYYCRLCYCLWNKGGQKTRYLTTYDATVYNLVLAIAGVDKRPPSLPCQRIKTTNKKYFKKDAIGSIIADLALIGFAVKVKDDETDGDTRRAFLLNLIFKRVLKKAADDYKELYDKSYAAISAMDKLQRDHAPIEDVLSAYGKAMEYSFHYCFDLPDKYLRVINLTARWILLIDMLDDYDDDVKKKAVNSLYREDSPTLDRLFERHYKEIIPIIHSESGNLSRALDEIECEKIEWVILQKIIRHSLATLVPNILNGEDVRYHYFRDTFLRCKKMHSEKEITRKYEKDPVYYKGN